MTSTATLQTVVIFHIWHLKWRILKHCYLFIFSHTVSLMLIPFRKSAIPKSLLSKISSNMNEEKLRILLFPLASKYYSSSSLNANSVKLARQESAKLSFSLGDKFTQEWLSRRKIEHGLTTTSSSPDKSHLVTSTRDVLKLETKEKKSKKFWQPLSPHPSSLVN